MAQTIYKQLLSKNSLLTKPLDKSLFSYTIKQIKQEHECKNLSTSLLRNISRNFIYDLPKIDKRVRKLL